MIILENADNTNYKTEQTFDLIYCDMIYENKDLSWIPIWWSRLKDNGIFIVQTDFHTNWLIRWFFETQFYYTTPVFINHLVWKNEWGNFPKDRFHQCYDDIIIYSKGKNHKFYPLNVQVPKATEKTKLNPSGRETKTATAWIDDICLTTTSKERVKKADGHLIKWQKPLKLFDRIISPFTDAFDWVADPFAGSGSLGEWCKNNDRNYLGLELDKEVFELAKKRLE